MKLVMGQAERGDCGASTARWPDCSTCPTGAVAIEIALGGAMQNIVVDRGGRQGRHRLLKAPGRRPGHLPAHERHPARATSGTAVEREPGFVGMGDELISFDRSI
ncbi:MAG: hypothetical protein V8S34_03340 [Lawsonibacter sp.]